MCISNSTTQLIASSDEIIQSNEKEDQEIQNDPYLIEFVECAKFKHVFIDGACERDASI